VVAKFEYGNFECEKFLDAKKLNLRFEREKTKWQDLNVGKLKVRF
jgi:hypothetical protein